VNVQRNGGKVYDVLIDRHGLFLAEMVMELLLTIVSDGSILGKDGNTSLPLLVITVHDTLLDLLILTEHLTKWKTFSHNEVG